MNHGDNLKEKEVEKRRALLAQLGGLRLNIDRDGTHIQWLKQKEMKITGWSGTVKKIGRRCVSMLRSVR